MLCPGWLLPRMFFRYVFFYFQTMFKPIIWRMANSRSSWSSRMSWCRHNMTTTAVQAFSHNCETVWHQMCINIYMVDISLVSWYTTQFSPRYIKCSVLVEYAALQPQYEVWRISTTELSDLDGSMKYGEYAALQPQYEVWRISATEPVRLATCVIIIQLVSRVKN